MQYQSITHLPGERFGQLVVIGAAPRPPKSRENYWLARCDCGNEVATPGSHMRQGMRTSCIPCGRKRQANGHLTHGMKASSEYTAWISLRDRCKNPNNNRYHRYGARGITVCDRWAHSFENFYADMGARPSSEHSIDRIDNNGPYTPENCRWATRSEQLKNRSVTILMTYSGRTMTPFEWSKEVGIHPTTLKHRRDLGWSDERALTEPVRTTRSAPTSLYRGVSWDKRLKRWKATISIAGTRTYLGVYKSEIEAAEAVQLARVG